MDGTDSETPQLWNAVIRIMGNQLCWKCNPFRELQPSSCSIKGFRSKASSPDRLARLAPEVVFP
jgi:hypothetical protein